MNTVMNDFTLRFIFHNPFSFYTNKAHYLDLAKAMEQIGVSTIIYTDISKDGTLTGPNLQELDAINLAVSCNIVASGGISNLDDITALRKLGLYGAICGKSLYQGTLDLKEAIREAEEVRLC